MKKQGEKSWSGVSIDKKSLKLNKEIKRKINHLCFVQCFIQCFAEVKNLRNLAKKMGRKTGY